MIAGVRFTKLAGSLAVRVREVIVDGQLDPDAVGCDANIALLDVTGNAEPFPIGTLKAQTAAHNRRTFISVPFDRAAPDAFVLPQAATDRTYEIRVRLKDQYRPNPLSEVGCLATGVGVAHLRALVPISSLGADICSVAMATQPSGPGNSPVVIRMSRKTGS